MGLHGIHGKIDCCNCGKKCIEFTVSSSDRTQNVGSATNNVRTLEQVMASLETGGRPVARLAPGKYTIGYVGGIITPGCGSAYINCEHYDNYFVTSLGPLQGFIGWSGRNTQALLEQLKEAKPLEYTVGSGGMLFKVGYFPWWYDSYLSGSVTYELCAITGRINTNV
jgi:hypothetical protein